MKKHYVLIEYTPDMDIEAKNIPWPAILEGAVKVSNWKDITKQSLTDFEVIAGIGQVFSDTGELTTEQVMEIIGKEDTKFPEELTYCEANQYEAEDYAYKLVEEVGSGIVAELCSLLQINRWEMA